MIDLFSISINSTFSSSAIFSHTGIIVSLPLKWRLVGLWQILILSFSSSPGLYKFVSNGKKITQNQYQAHLKLLASQAPKGKQQAPINRQAVLNNESHRWELNP